MVWKSFRLYPCDSASGRVDVLKLVRITEEFIVTAFSIDSGLEVVLSVPKELGDFVRDAPPICVEPLERCSFPWECIVAAVALEGVPNLDEALSLLVAAPGYSALQLYAVCEGGVCHVETRLATDSEAKLSALLRGLKLRRLKAPQRGVYEAMRRLEPLGKGSKVKLDELAKRLVIDAGKLSKYSLQVPPELPWIPLDEFLSALAGGGDRIRGSREREREQRQRPSRRSDARRGRS